MNGQGTHIRVASSCMHTQKHCCAEGQSTQTNLLLGVQTGPKIYMEVSKVMGVPPNIQVIGPWLSIETETHVDSGILCFQKSPNGNCAEQRPHSNHSQHQECSCWLTTTFGVKGGPKVLVVLGVLIGCTNFSNQSWPWRWKYTSSTSMNSPFQPHL